MIPHASDSCQRDKYFGLLALFVLTSHSGVPCKETLFNDFINICYLLLFEVSGCQRDSHVIMFHAAKEAVKISILSTRTPKPRNRLIKSKVYRIHPFTQSSILYFLTLMTPRRSLSWFVMVLTSGKLKSLRR